MVQPHWNEERARHWALFMPPARPSRGEMACYERFLSESGPMQAGPFALLGCTPEIRSLCATRRRPLICIDWNAGVYHALASMVDPKHSEVLVASDWLKAEVPEPVDIVFADGSLNMLPPDMHAPLIKKMSSMLKPNGRALIRVHVAAAPSFSSAQDVFRWYRREAVDQPVFTATRTHLDMLWVEPKTLKISFPAYHQKIVQLHADGDITDDEFQSYHKLLEFNKINLWYTTRESFERAAREWFDVEASDCGQDYAGHNHHPVYALRKK